jgi:DNA-binding MarR family transcriptional regulator
VLAAVAAGEGQTITGVAQRAGTEIYTTSRLLAAATRNGLVSRRPGADARAVVVSLTRSGRRLVSRITPQARLLERRALAGLPAEDSERLLALLKRIVGNLSGGNRSGGRLSGPARAAAGPSTKAVLR